MIAIVGNLLLCTFGHLHLYDGTPTCASRQPILYADTDDDELVRMLVCNGMGTC